MFFFSFFRKNSDRKNSELIWPLCCLFWKVINIFATGLFRLFILVWVLANHDFQGIGPFSIGYSIPFYTFNFHRICSNSPSFISNINNLCPFSFFLSLARVLLILLSSSKNHLLISVIFLYWFFVCFQFYWFLLISSSA